MIQATGGAKCANLHNAALKMPNHTTSGHQVFIMVNISHLEFTPREFFRMSAAGSRAQDDSRQFPHPRK
jgi:hypothetical protein